MAENVDLTNKLPELKLGNYHFKEEKIDNMLTLFMC